MENPPLLTMEIKKKPTRSKTINLNPLYETKLH